MTTITLPPLPEPFPAGYIAQTEYFYTADQLRARDLEVARLVLEGAAQFFRENDSLLFWGSQAASHINDIEVKHHE
jgi:hypothetical protein